MDKIFLYVRKYYMYMITLTNFKFEYFLIYLFFIMKMKAMLFEMNGRNKTVYSKPVVIKFNMKMQGHPKKRQRCILCMFCKILN